MNNSLTTKIRAAKRLVLVMLAVLLSVSGVPMLSPNAKAAQLANRYIQMSDSGPSGTSITTGVGSGTGVTYRLSFDISANANSFIVDFCEETPLLQAVCTRPSGMTTATGYTSVAGEVTAANNWTMSNVAGQVKFQNTGTPGEEMTSTTQTIDLTGIDNPDFVGSFYARITTYSNSSWGTYVDPTNVGAYVDYGGVALTTVPTIQITARVEEQLDFCLSSVGSWQAASNCGDALVAANPPVIELGHGSAPVVLDSQNRDTANLYSQLSTNASSGAVVRLRNSNTSCGGLSSDDGATCAIPAHNSGSGAGASAMPIGTASFGLFVSDSSLGTGGVGSLTPSTAYHDAAHTTIPTDLWYGMDTTTANNNTISAFGSTICSTNSPAQFVNTTYVFAATASLTTPAGIYEANLSMIATGTF